MRISKAVSRAAYSTLILVLVFSTLTLGQSPAKTSAQTQSGSNEDLRRQIEELKQGQDAIRKDIEEIKRLLLAREAGARPARPERMTINARPFKGSGTAKVVVVEFSDYQCPFCGRFYRDTLPQIDKEFIQTGKIKYVFNNLPLDELHPVAFKAAQAAECAGEQGKFWELHGKFFSDQNIIARGDMTAPAKSVGLDLSQFEKCLTSGKTEGVVRAGVEQAESLGIQSTPSFVIGTIDEKTNDVKIIGVINGAYPFSVFKTALEKALGK